MPMIRNKLKELSGTTLNTSLSPDLSIAHGATYYAGMLLTLTHDDLDTLYGAPGLEDYRPEAVLA